MSNSSLKLACLVLAIAVILFAAFSSYCFFTTVMLNARVAFAEDQVEIFDEMRLKALAAESPGRAVSYLEYAVRYYPSGSKQEVGTRLDSVVESHRKSVVRDIIADLRIKSGKDYGDDPQAWIEQFSSSHRNSSE